MFKILSEKKYNILHNLKADDYKKIRRDMIYNIMCTDMKEHVDLMKNFKELDKKIKGSGEEYSKPNFFD